MNYIKINGETITYPYLLERLYSDHPDTSFPENISVDLLKSFGIYSVERTEPDEYPELVTVEKLPELVNGQWFMRWEYRSPTPEEHQNQSDYIREERNSRLSKCDWTLLPDVNVDIDAWKSYRQQLRDITTQVGFPWQVAWPAQPE